MKLLRQLPVVALLALSLVSCSTENLNDTADSLAENLVSPAAKAIEIEILDIINDHRLSQGLDPLNDMKVVKSVAFSHTDYMVDKNVVSHDNFYKRSTYLKENAGASKVSENVAYGYTSAESVVNAWLKSESHKANIEGDYTNFDVSAEQNDEGKWYYTNIFIKR
ncbi:CAP domain-containing protein [Aestuariivivens sediminicola]|uniref:CAP domain-containing protein n=1 Tax=Aestuariivivens sediminicola TaxID=2913560 RepID=UPI001F59E601|nr:CAP domain-containing protein [Aestuariivivens sediminicola]